MSDGQRKFLTWVAIILFLAYLGNINLGKAAGNLGHTVQQVHNSNAHP